MRITVKLKGLDNLDKPMKKIKQAVLVANTKLYNACVEGTPVDTGFARASWWAQADGLPTEKGSGPAAIPASVGRVLSVVNSAAYIRKLEYDGHSAQNVGWVNRAAAAYPGWLRDALASAGGAP